VLVPALVVAVLELLSDTVLDEALPFPWDTILVTLAVLGIGAALAGVAFRRIDALTGALVARNEDLEARGAASRALHRVSVAIASMTDVDDVLQAVVDHARRLLDADVAVLLLEGPDGELHARAASGAVATVPHLPSVSGAPVAAGAAGGDTGRRPSPAAADSAADAIIPFVQPGSAVVRLSAPLQRGGQTIGLLGIGAAVTRGFDADEVETLASLANQATIALEHARLQARLRELAVVEERERIARELHDGIAQVLGYVNTKSQAIDGYLGDGRVDDARIQLAQLGAAARAVYVDVREAILGLRSPLEPGQGIGLAIETHARRVAEDSRFTLDVSIMPEARDLRLPPDTGAQVYRIAQEALTNIRKHAGANRVRIRMEASPVTLRLSIGDDGHGLGRSASGEPTPDVPRYGLRSMRERAESIGATLDVANDPGGGVRVRLVLPLAAAVPAA
jgi:signal transduction histidine kinase